MTTDALLAPPPRAVARVLVDVSLPHLDRLFDYSVPQKWEDDAVPGARVRVRFAGRVYDGFIVERATTTPLDKLAPIEKVVSSEPVLSPPMADLVRAVADHYAGVAADVARLAIPPRHATTEKAARPVQDAPEQSPHDDTRGEPSPPDPGPFGDYPAGSALIAAIARGEAPRAAWQVASVADSIGDWAAGFAALAAAARASGRGALLLAPDARDLARLEAACAAVLGRGRYVVMAADAGPAARYRAFLAARRGDADVVLGTRAAVFAPVRNLGVIALWDDGDDVWSEPRAPYPHAREVACLRAPREDCALVLAAHARTAEVEALVERGWVHPVALPAGDARRREPVVRVAVDSDVALARDPAAHAARLPHAAFEAIRAGLAAGPVLVQVPRGGYRQGLACAQCREPARCVRCHGPLEQANSVLLRCRWCGVAEPRSEHRCAVCGSGRLRAARVGADRTAVELGRAFPGTALLQSVAGKVIAEVEAAPALVVATPGAEPIAASGYSAAILLDAELLLQRDDLRAGEEALRRWLAAVALVRPAADGGTVVVVGPATARPIQALVRHDPAGAAARELDDRAAAGFPPAVRLITIEGSLAALEDIAAQIELPTDGEALGPVPLPTTGKPGEPEDLGRLLLRAPLADGRALTAAVKQVSAARSARKAPGALRIRVDPSAL